MPAIDNPIIEQFAQDLAKGVRVGLAYGYGHPDCTKKTCSENGSRLAKKAHVIARISEIKGYSVKVEELATKKAIEAAAKRLSVNLLSMHERRQLLAERARRPRVGENALCSILRLDAQLAGELIDKTDLTTDGEALPAAMPSIQMNLPPSFLQRRTGSN